MTSALELPTTGGVSHLETVERPDAAVLARTGASDSYGAPVTPQHVRRIAPPHGVVTPQSVQVRVAWTMAEIEALGPAWLALEAGATTPVFFQSFAWCRHVLATLQRADPAGARCGPVVPFVLSAWKDETLLAVWPLQLTRESGARILTDLSSPFGQYADLILARAAAPASEDLCRHMIAQARSLSQADALVLRKVRADTSLGRVLVTLAQPLHAPQKAPFVPMTGFTTFEAFHATTKAKTRKNVRNAMHRLEKIGSLRHLVERRSARMDAVLSQCFDLRSDWLEEKGLTSTAFAHPAFAALVRGCADPASHEIDILSMMLMLDDQPISIHYGFVHNRRYYAYMAARNPAYDACSPGKVHLAHVLEACFAHGVEIVDLLGPEMPYKLVWATEAIATEDFGLTWTLRGWLAIDIWRRHLRPYVRSRFLALPSALRSRLANRLRAGRGTSVTPAPWPPA